MNAMKVTFGIIGGIAVGALVGVLFAPAKGSATRRKIIHRGEEYSDELKEKFDDLIDSIADQYDEKAKAIVNMAIKK